MQANAGTHNLGRAKVLFVEIAILCFGVVLQAQTDPTVGQNSRLSVFVEPDVQVSSDGDVVHMESYIAASTDNPDVLLAGGELIYAGRKLNISEARIYRSENAGATWLPVLLPNELNGGWDNAIVGGPRDTAYFVTSNLEKGVTVYRTTDSGLTWASSIPAGVASWDRPHVAVDLTTSPYEGRLYVAGEGAEGVQLITSTDGGRTFSSPVTACPHREGWNAATSASPLILQDGTLLVPCLPYPNDPERATWTSAEAGLVTSTDGGKTFGEYHSVGIVHKMLAAERLAARVRGDVFFSGNFMQGPMFAVAPRGSPFVDRVYAVWQDIDSSGSSKLLIAWSADHGKNWSIPLTVGSTSSSNDSPVRQGVPMVAVAPDGVLGVAWFDGRLAPDRRGYDVYFTASADGGRTFLPAVRVSSKTSRPETGLNMVPSFDISKSSPEGTLQIHMTSPFTDRATGGDYSSMAVDASGRFHPLWADARTGTWQLYTSTIRVLSEDALSKLSPHPSCSPSGDQVQLVFDEALWDSAANALTVPVRLINISNRPITSAITVQLWPSLADQSWVQLLPPDQIVPKMFADSNSGSSGPATLVFQPSLESPLFPQGVTAPAQWKMQIPAAAFMNFYFNINITMVGCATR